MPTRQSAADIGIISNLQAWLAALDDVRNC
jgi:hypothetical protein